MRRKTRRKAIAMMFRGKVREGNDGVGGAVMKGWNEEVLGGGRWGGATGDAPLQTDGRRCYCRSEDSSRCE